MATHDADKSGPTEARRRTMTRDPNATGGAIVETPEKDADGNHVTAAGSTHLTANIDGKWRVVNTKGEPLLKKEFDSESDAVDYAQEKNNARAE